MFIAALFIVVQTGCKKNVAYTSGMPFTRKQDRILLFAASSVELGVIRLGEIS